MPRAPLTLTLCVSRSSSGTPREGPAGGTSSSGGPGGSLGSRGRRRKLYSAVPGRSFMAVKSYQAQGEGEISLSKGEKIKGNSQAVLRGVDTKGLLEGTVHTPTWERSRLRNWGDSSGVLEVRDRVQGLLGSPGPHPLAITNKEHLWRGTWVRKAPDPHPHSHQHHQSAPRDEGCHMRAAFTLWVSP